jgi:C-terminal peptidase prc
LLAALAVPVHADAPEGLYRSALERIDSVYLWRDELDIERVLETVGDQVQADLEWAMVKTEGQTLTLFHGDGQKVGEIRVESWDGLEAGLVALEGLIRGSGYPIDPELDLQVVLLRGVADSLDRHSRVLYGEKLKSFDKRLKGTLVGIGAKIGLAEHAVVLKEVYPDTPARDNGLRPGDHILRIDGVSTMGMSVDDAVDHITGPKGSLVELLVEREHEQFELTLVREEIRIPNLTWRPLDSGLGYIAIDHFSEQTVTNLEAALSGLAEVGALENGLVLDLRGNTGGSMIQSAKVADQFLEMGTLVRTEGRGGAPVNGLISKIKAQDTNMEPEVPLVILQDNRTASGSEIVAGALRELDRAVLIGTRSYGKGTVQKVYTLGPGTRLKLTVAQYLLPGGLSIRDLGLAPDLEVGKLIFDDDGVRQSGGDESADALLYVDEHRGWRDDAPDARGDYLEELARRVLLASDGYDRASVLAALEQVAAEARVEEEALLASTFDARRLDWSPAPADGDMPQVEVELENYGALIAGEKVELRARVRNLGKEPLHRVVVDLSSDDTTWRGRMMPIGRLDPGQTAEGWVRFTIGAGRNARESDVSVRVEADRRPGVTVSPAVLRYESDPVPPVAMQLKLQPEGDAWSVGVDLENRGDETLYDVRVRLQYPETTAVELTRYDAGVSTLKPGTKAHVELGLQLLDDTPAVPLVVHVKADTFGEIAEWPVSLMRSGAPQRLVAPEVEAPGIPTSAPVGPLELNLSVTDDRSVENLVLWVDGEKIAYTSGDGPAQSHRFPVTVNRGTNRSVYATDDQGLQTKETWYVRGTEPVTSDAEE